MSSIRIVEKNGKRYIAVKVSFNQKEKCKKVPGYKWDKSGKQWLYPISVFTLYELVKQFPKATLDRESQKLLKKYNQVQHANEYKIKNKVGCDGLPEDLWHHQKVAICYMKEVLS